MMHRGKQMIAASNVSAMPHWQCWCGVIWFSTNVSGLTAFVEAYRWCLNAPAGRGTAPPPHVLSMVVDQPKWTADTPLPYAVTARVGSVSTMIATVATPTRALLTAHALQLTYENNPDGFRHSW